MAKRRIGWALALALVGSTVSPAFAADNGALPRDENSSTSSGNSSGPPRLVQKGTIKDTLKNTFGPKLKHQDLEKMYYKGKLVYHVTLPGNVENIKKEGLRTGHGGGDRGMSEALPDSAKDKRAFKKSSKGHVHLGNETAMKFYHEYAGEKGKEAQLFAVRKRGLTLFHDPDTHEGEGYRTKKDVKPKQLVHVTNDQFNDITKLPSLKPHRNDFVADHATRSNLVVKHTTPEPRREFRATVRRATKAIFRPRGRRR